MKDNENSNPHLKGSGLGLHISKQIAESMDGSLTCQSEYGVGSTFKFKFKAGMALNEIRTPVQCVYDFRKQEFSISGVQGGNNKENSIQD